MRTAVAALSLANLLMVRLWAELLGEHDGFVEPAWRGAAILNLGLLAAAIWAVARWGGTVGRWALAGVGAALFTKELILAAGHEAQQWKMRLAMVVDAGSGQAWVWVGALAGIGLLIWAARRMPWRWVPQALLMLSPILAVTAGQTAMRLTFPSGRAPARETALGGPAKPGARVVWIVFDELDERLAFSERPAGLRLPGLDAFRGESVVFRQAFSPSDSTAVAVPQLLGKVLEGRSYRSGVVGWYLPYCEIYGKELADCRSWPMNRQLNSYAPTVAGAVRDQIRSLFESSLFSVFGQSLAVEAHVKTILEMEQAAIEMAGRRDLNLMFLHLPAPHQPHVYDAERKTLTASNQNSEGYWGSLRLADRLFSGIRQRLESGGLWRESHVLVTGDHGFRQAARLGYGGETLHVPLMWKPAGKAMAREVTGRFETAQSAALVARLLGGEGAESVLAGYP